MSTPTPRNHRLTNLADAWEGPPSEDQFDKARRQGRELEEYVDAAERQARDRRQRQAAYAEQAPRTRALAQMGRETFGRRGLPSTQARRRELHAHPVYRSLPADARAAWDALVADSEAAADGGDYAGLWASIEQLASEQAGSGALDEWDVHAATHREDNDPTELAAMIPRGTALVPRRSPER